MADFLQTLHFAFSITGPIFVILTLGVYLKRIGLLNDAFIETGSRLVFNVSLPALLFISISQSQWDTNTHFSLVGYGILATIFAYLLLEGLARFTIYPKEDRGVVVQGAFRSNMGIIGLAYCVNAYGQAGLAAASLYVGVITILFNILSVITLNHSLHTGDKQLAAIIKGIVTNPLIIGIVLAMPFAWFHWQLPSVLIQSGEYFAQMTLPLALLCTGASLNFYSLQQEWGKTLAASLGKLIFTPFLFALGALAFGFAGMDLGILMLMAFSPTAAASYIMVRAMRGNAVLAANIIALTSIGSLLTTSLGIVILKSYQLM